MVEPQRQRSRRRWSKEGLARLHPAHTAYVFAQKQVPVISEQIAALDEMAPFAEMVSEAEDLYLPSGPPMSPLTGSYFTSWAFFDAGWRPFSWPAFPTFPRADRTLR